MPNPTVPASALERSRAAPEKVAEKVAELVPAALEVRVEVEADGFVVTGLMVDADATAEAAASARAEHDTLVDELLDVHDTAMAEYAAEVADAEAGYRAAMAEYAAEVADHNAALAETAPGDDLPPVPRAPEPPALSEPPPAPDLPAPPVTEPVLVALKVAVDLLRLAVEGAAADAALPVYLRWADDGTTGDGLTAALLDAGWSELSVVLVADEDGDPAAPTYLWRIDGLPPDGGEPAPHAAQVAQAIAARPPDPPDPRADRRRRAQEAHDSADVPALVALLAAEVFGLDE